MPAGHPPDDGPLRALLHSAHEAFVSMDAEGHVLVWNRMASETFGWWQEARGRLLGDLIVPERYREAHETGLRRLAATGEGRIVNRRIEIESLHRDGHELPVELTISPMQTHAGVVFNAFLHDISDRREAEAGARRLAALVEGSEDAIVASDLDGTLTDWNPGAQRLYGYSAEEALGMSVSMLRPSGEGEEVEQLLLQRGSPESKELDKAGTESDESQQVGRHADARSPRWARTGGLRTTLYSNSLLLVMGAIWLASWLAQSITGRSSYNEQRFEHHQDALSYPQYLGSADFWESTLQNWQSEFLAVGSMAIFRRLPAPAGLAGVQTGRGRARRYEPDRIRTQVAGGRRAPRVGLTCLPVGNP